MAEHQRVCAVVVTYNRKELLVGCLDALLGQSYVVDRILVIDNASTDGTRAALIERGYAANPRVEHVVLPTNVGGAGGFHAGFKRALALEPDWIWAMDDDGLAHPDCLANLLAAPASAGEFRGPLVLAREEMANADNDELAFPMAVETPSGSVSLRRRGDAENIARDGVVTGYACVFNGVLIHRRAVERLGLPDERFFIWGDEWDYIARARRAGMPMTTMLSALYWHPRDRTQCAKVRFCGRDYDVPCSNSRFRNYLLIRNYAYLAYRYRGLVPWLRHTLKYFLFYMREEGWGAALRSVIYSIEGLTARLTGHTRFEQ